METSPRGDHAGGQLESKTTKQRHPSQPVLATYIYDAEHTHIHTEPQNRAEDTMVRAVELEREKQKQKKIGFVYIAAPP